VIFAGKLRDRVTIQQKSVGRAANGEEIVTWVNVIANAPAEVKVGGAQSFLRGRELVVLNTALSETTVQVRMRYRSGLNTTMRITWQGNPYYVAEVLPGGKGNKSEVMLLCRGEVEDSA
jgi:SPP1 family predicted phage head-tail adaptor